MIGRRRAPSPRRPTRTSAAIYSLAAWCQCFFQKVFHRYTPETFKTQHANLITTEYLRRKRLRMHFHSKIDRMEGGGGGGAHVHTPMWQGSEVCSSSGRKKGTRCPSSSAGRARQLQRQDTQATRWHSQRRSCQFKPNQPTARPAPKQCHQCGRPAAASRWGETAKGSKGEKRRGLQKQRDSIKTGSSGFYHQGQ